MRKLRFCSLTTFYPPYNFGGDGIDVQRTARALVRRGHEVTVVHDVDAYQWLAGRTLEPEPLSSDGVEVVSLRSRLGVVAPFLTHQLGHPIVHRRGITRLIRERAFDVVILNNVSLVGGPGLMSLAPDALTVYMAHEHWLVCPTHVLWRFNREACDARMCGRCVLRYGRPPQLWRYTGLLERRVSDVDLFVARSAFSRDKHHQFGFSRPMEVLPYFLPGPIPELPDRRPTPRPHEPPYFLFVGRLTRIKGLECVIPVFRRYPAADLLVIGDGEEMPALRALAAGLPNVKFLGRVPNEDLEPYYQHAIAALMPTLGYETFGIVLIEAFRYGTPVIARRIGPLPEVVDAVDGGLLFADDEELVGAMTRLQQDTTFRDACAASGYRACREHWSEDVVIGRFLEMIGTALERRSESREPAPGRGQRR
jgi:glycosyltransferase involved in cell wall biosynthesis